MVLAPMYIAIVSILKDIVKNNSTCILINKISPNLKLGLIFAERKRFEHFTLTI